MKVVVISKKSFTTAQYNNVSNIALSGTTVTLTYTGGTAQYSVNDYIVQIMIA